MSEIPGTAAPQPRFPTEASAAGDQPPPGKGRRLWWLAGAAAVVVVAAVGTIMAVSGGDAWHPKLPHCTQLAAKLPGKPTLAEELRTDGTETSAGESRPIRLASLACTSGAATRVSVDIFDSGKYDPRTLAPYRDGKVHDGPARAQAMFATETRGMTAVSPTEAYGSVDYAGGDCTTIEVERNVLVAVTFKGRGATPQERKANCREDGAKPTASVIHSIG